MHVIPINVSHNGTFPADTRKLRKPNDLKCDNMGALRNNGVRKKHFFFNFDCHNDTATVDFLEDSEGHNMYTFKGSYHKNMTTLIEMIVNPDKLQAIVVKRNNKMKDSYSLNINQQVINSENSEKLLGVEIDNQLSFEKHISTLVKKASNQLNVISRIQKFMGFKEKEILLKYFVYSNFNYCPLMWHFRSAKSAKR